MTSVEFHLARITAKSQGLQPRLPGGALPHLTAEDIALAAATVPKRPAYFAIMAKYCQDEKAEDHLLAYTVQRGWWLWQAKGRSARTAVPIQRRVAELSVLYFLNPEQGKRRGIGGCAIYCGMARNTWKTHYQLHFDDLTAHLFALESEAAAHIRKVLK